MPAWAGANMHEHEKCAERQPTARLDISSCSFTCAVRLSQAGGVVLMYLLLP